MVKKTTIETIKLNTFCWLGHVQRKEGNRIPQKLLYMYLQIAMLRGRPNVCILKPRNTVPNWYSGPIVRTTD
jgi:hypothetical protein